MFRRHIFCSLNLIFILLSFSQTVFAICPLCTLVVGGGVGLSHWLGVDDTISGLWIGGLTMSLIIWTVSWLNQHNIHFKGRKILITTLYYLLIIGSLQIQGWLGHSNNQLCGIDKLLLGLIVGSIFFLAGSLTYDFIKTKRKKAHFPFEKIVLPILPLIILSFLFYWITM